jgi:hypothetical protein
MRARGYPRRTQTGDEQIPVDIKVLPAEKPPVTGELFPIISDAAEPLGKAVGGTLADTWQAIIGDRVTAWRIRNAVGVDKKLRASLAETGVKLNVEKLPEGFAFRWFERATETDEPEIQELFAKLLANAASGSEDALRKRNVELVSNLTPEDARLLSYVAERYAEFKVTKSALHSSFAMDYDWSFMRHYKAAGFDSELPIDALLSLGILRLDRDFRTDGSDIGRAISAALSGQFRGDDIGLSHMLEQEEKLVLTEVGKSLLNALFPD